MLLVLLVHGHRANAAADGIAAARLAFEREHQAAPPGQWVLYSGGAVLAPGNDTAWDAFQVGSPVVLRDGKAFRMWYRGCGFAGDVYTCSIGHATSADGISWVKSAAAVMTPPEAHERQHLNSFTIVRAGEYYWMWYAVEPDWFVDKPYGTIHLATSKDGLSWTLRGAVIRALSRWTPSLQPTALFDGKVFHLWYADYPTDDDRALLHVTSSDGAKWQTAATYSLRDMKMNPGRLAIVDHGGEGFLALFHSGARDASQPVPFGMLVSADGNQWRKGDSTTDTRGPQDAAKSMDNGLRRKLERASSPSAIPLADGIFVWFTSGTPEGAEEVWLAFLKQEPR